MDCHRTFVKAIEMRPVPKYDSTAQGAFREEASRLRYFTRDLAAGFHDLGKGRDALAATDALAAPLAHLAPQESSCVAS